MLAGNPMRYIVAAGEPKGGTKSVTKITFSDIDPVEDHSMTVEIMGIERVFSLKTVPVEIYELPAAWADQPVNYWAASIYDRLLKIYDLVNNYLISIEGPEITFEALEPGDTFNIIPVSSTINGITIEPVTGGDVESGTVEGVLMQVRDGYGNLLGEDFKPYETQGLYSGMARFDASEYLYAQLLSFSPPHFYLSFPGYLHHKYSDYVLKYMVGFAEKVSGVIQPFVYDTYRYALGGGFSRERLVYNNKNWVDYFKLSENQQKFLTWAPREKMSHPLAKESLFFLFQLPGYKYFRIKVEAWDHGSGHALVNATDLLPITSWSVFELTVGYQALNLEFLTEKPAVRWTVWLVNELGQTISEKRTFYLDPKYQETVRHFRFRNSFGAYDSIMCTGKFQVNLEYERETAGFSDPFEKETPYNSLKRATEIKEKITKKAVTGWVKQDYLSFLLDFMRSLEVYEIDIANIYPVIITTKKTSFLKDQDYNYALEFDYETANLNDFYSTLINSLDMIQLSDGVKGKVDPTDGTTIYIGFPTAGVTSEASSAWAIKRVQIDSVTGVITETWADGDLECNKKWTERAELTYSFLK